MILLASPDPWLAQELSSPLGGAGFHVITAHNEPETLECTHGQRPHAIVVDVAIAPPGFGLCRTLRSASFGTPIVLVCQGEAHPSRADILEAVRAGAWDFRGTPLDVEDLVLRIVAYVEPKRELDRVSEECLLDRVSGLYNHLGLAKRGDELAALATRHGLALACMVFRPGNELPTRASDRLAVTFRSVARASDAVGRIGRAEFAVFAAAGNSWSARRLVHRLTDRATGYGSGFDVRTGFSASGPSQKISSYTLLARARHALEGGNTS